MLRATFYIKQFTKECFFYLVLLSDEIVIKEELIQSEDVERVLFLACNNPNKDIDQDDFDIHGVQFKRRHCLTFEFHWLVGFSSYKFKVQVLKDGYIFYIFLQKFAWFSKKEPVMPILIVKYHCQQIL